jgi:ribosomal protein S18 acetylase RimI-like enzyme
MTFFRIDQLHPHLIHIQKWYEGAFPITERRHFDDLLALLSDPDMYLCALLDTDQLIGFILYWQWPDFLFVEHFVIDPDQRGKQYGQQVLAQLLKLDSPYYILEVERPEDDISQRRVRFYERQGFTLNLYDYWQPPYQPGMVAVPMRLMSIPAITHAQDFERFSKLIKTRVYQRFYY